MESKSPFRKEDQPITKNNVILNNQNKLILSGIQEVYSTNDKMLILKANNKKLTISGNNINITKLLVDSGELEATGNFDCIKYSTSNQGSILKRIFK